jgi:hypothetical protein
MSCNGFGGDSDYLATLAQGSLFAAAQMVDALQCTCTNFEE